MTGTVNKVVEQRRQQRPVFAGAVHALVLTIGLAGCTPTVTKHGHLLSQADLQQIQPGSSKEQVTTTLGTPDTTSTVDGGAYYYISTTREQKAFMKSNHLTYQKVHLFMQN